MAEKFVFPERGRNSDNSGLTLRELYAGMVMQGLLADTEVVDEPAQLAGVAVEYADALIEKLEE